MADRPRDRYVSAMTDPTVITRFAPSPTGFLHIGGARTALFNWLFARHYGGRFHLRIEDTDRERSTRAAVDAIIDGMRWLGLDWDGEVVSQFERRAAHADAAQRLMAEGKAYHCYASKEELETMRATARADGRPPRYDGRWRDRDPAEAPAGVAPVVRFKAPRDGETVIDDAVQGRVTVSNDQLDDMVLLRADGTPTYMLSVVIDDIDMGITHVIRGDDHLTNAFRQTQLYRALGVTPPVFAHIPLIHGPDGTKLSKRHGALGVEAYREMGYLPEAVRNYLLRLGWGHGDAEIISTDQAIAWFGLDGCGKAAARFDFIKLQSLNAHYIKEADPVRLVDAIAPRIEALIGQPVDETGRERLRRGMDGLKPRAKTLVDLAELGAFYARSRPVPLDDKAAKLLSDEARGHLRSLSEKLADLPEWNEHAIDAACRDVAETFGLKLGKLAQPLRAALTGTTVSPGIFEVASVLGRPETLGRLTDVVQERRSA